MTNSHSNSVWNIMRDRIVLVLYTSKHASYVESLSQYVPGTVFTVMGNVDALIHNHQLGVNSPEAFLNAIQYMWEEAVYNRIVAGVSYFGGDDGNPGLIKPPMFIITLLGDHPWVDRPLSLLGDKYGTIRMELSDAPQALLPALEMISETYDDLEKQDDPNIVDVTYCRPS